VLAHERVNENGDARPYGHPDVVRDHFQNA
jgi:hypothetical protein